MKPEIFIRGILVAVLILVGAHCLTSPPESMPEQNKNCAIAYEYSRDRYQDITGQYQSTNIVLTSTGLLLYFIFPEALAIPVVGLPISYIQHESLAESNVETLNRDCKGG